MGYVIECFMGQNIGIGIWDLIQGWDKGHTYVYLFIIWTYSGQSLDIFRDRYKGAL